MTAKTLNKLLFLIAFIAIPYSLLSQSHIFNVVDFGAIGDGKFNNNTAIEACFRKASQHPNSKVIIPYGNYRIERQVVVSSMQGDIEIEGILNENGNSPILYSSKNTSVLWVKGYLHEKAQGSVKIKNIILRSSNIPFSKKHSMTNNKKWNSGLAITDKRDAYIENVVVENIYGQGIYISDSQQTGIPLSARFQNVVIKNCNILNVWGYNPTSDDYGDGIYLSNVANASIYNNYIKNDFTNTRQLGRAGIVIEYMAEDCHIYDNYIFGYDRGMHIEADYGHHKITHNNIEGTDMGIVIYSPNIAGHNNPIEISHNTISNEQLPKKNKLNRVRGIGSVADRALLDFTAPNYSRKGSIINSNTFLINGNFDYFSNSIINIRAHGVNLINNTYNVINTNHLSHPIHYFNFSENTVMNGERLSGIKGVVLKGSTRKEQNDFIRNNKIDNKTILIN